MEEPKKNKPKRSVADRAWAFLRKSLQGKADCVVVFRLTQKSDGSWDVDWAARHWLLESGDDLPPGVGWAISQELARGSFARTVGPIAADTILSAASNLLGQAVGKVRSR